MNDWVTHWMFTCRIATAWAGDSRMVLGRQVCNEEGQSFMQAVELTEDHKPDNPIECRRINEAGGRVDRLVSGMGLLESAATLFKRRLPCLT